MQFSSSSLGADYTIWTQRLVIERRTGTELLDERLLSSSTDWNFKPVGEREHATRTPSSQRAYVFARDPPGSMDELPFVPLFGDIFQRTENQGIASSGVNPHVLQLRSCRDQIGTERRW